VYGITELRLADLSQDGYLVEKAYKLVQKVLNNPERYKDLLAEVERFFPPEKIGVN